MESRWSLRTRMGILLSGTLLVILGATGYNLFSKTRAIVDAESGEAARQVATTIGNSMATFGETGDMAGLELFLGTISSRKDLESVHAVRSPVTAAEFKERAGAQPKDEMEKQVLASGKEQVSRDADKNLVRFVIPITAEKRCVSCHNAAKENDVLGAVSVTVRTDRAASALASIRWSTVTSFSVGILLEISLLLFLITRGVVGPIQAAVTSLFDGATQVASASGQLSSSSQGLAEGSSEQAASLEETASAMEEMSAMTKRNAESAGQAKSLADQAGASVEKSNASMQSLVTSMAEISMMGEETGKIIKTIDEIAFQTNLLALNAAVEAARAGEAGAGFAVVADEVRNLAQRAAGAAKNTSELIEGTIRKIKDGTVLVEKTNADFGEVASAVTKVTELVAEISAASSEQSRGIDEVSTAIGQMDKVTQGNAANAEEIASAAEELSAQALSMEDVVRGLQSLVEGKGVAAIHSEKRGAPAPQAYRRKMALPAGSAQTRGDRSAPGPVGRRKPLVGIGKNQLSRDPEDGIPFGEKSMTDF
jgi:hypothetical protein